MVSKQLQGVYSCVRKFTSLYNRMNVEKRLNFVMSRVNILRVSNQSNYKSHWNKFKLGPNVQGESLE